MQPKENKCSRESIGVESRDCHFVLYSLVCANFVGTFTTLFITGILSSLIGSLWEQKNPALHSLYNVIYCYPVFPLSSPFTAIVLPVDFYASQVVLGYML